MTGALGAPMVEQERVMIIMTTVVLILRALMQCQQKLEAAVWSSGHSDQVRQGVVWSTSSAVVGRAIA